MAIGLSCAGVLLFLVIAATSGYLRWRCQRLSPYLQPQDEIFEMNPDAKPNLARLRLIVETELRRGGILGSGAFGAVFKVRSNLDFLTVI